MKPLLQLLWGCGKPAFPPRAKRSFTDGRGKSVSRVRPPRRIVPIIPSAPKPLLAVGAGDQLAAGVTTYCDWSPDSKLKPKIGDIVIDSERMADGLEEATRNIREKNP
jgi:ABC-type Fe3+-hydroxamate transport system substrate-binding protein